MTSSKGSVQAELDSLIADFNGHPGLPAALCDISRRYESSGKYEQAKGVYQQIIQRYPDSPQADRAQLDVSRINILGFIRSGRDADAQAAVDKLIADFNDQPGVAQVLFSIAEKYFYKGNYQQAIELWELILNKYPQSRLKSGIPYLLATCYKQLEDNPTAIKYYKQVLHQYPYSRYAHRTAYRIALIYRFAGEYNNAIYWLEQQRELYPDKHLHAQRALLQQAAVYYFNLRDYEEAARVYHQYISEYPDEERIWVAYRFLARCYEKMGNTQQAIAVLEEALTRFSESEHASEIIEELKRVQEGGK